MRGQVIQCGRSIAGRLDLLGGDIGLRDIGEDILAAQPGFERLDDFMRKNA